MGRSPSPQPSPASGRGSKESDSLSRLRERAGVRVGERARKLRSTSTDAERLLWSKLRDRRLAGHKFRRQHPVGPFFADFACIECRLIVELDGGQHYDEEGLRRDATRTVALQEHGFDVLRFSNRDVLAETDAVLQVIQVRLAGSRLHPHPGPLPQAGEGAKT
ncbi:MAG: endonuclease domain-containing protein [Burkholderiales bacterium]|nr:endonuclease domain-containing protein [Burkholderiales bacterium]